MNQFKILIIVLLLSSCKNYSVHEQNLIEQHRSMLKYDKKSRDNQQKTRNKRKKVKRNKISRTKRKLI